MRRAQTKRPGWSFAVACGLCLALMAAVSWDVLAAGWVSRGGGALTVVGVGSVGGAAALARARVPRIVVVLLVPILGLVTIIPVTLGGVPAPSKQSIWTLVAHYVNAATTGLTSTQTWTFTVGLCGALFGCGCWLAWITLREHQGVVAVLPVFLVLAINVVNAATPGTLFVPEGIAVGLGLGVIAAAHRESLGAQWAANRITPLGGLGWRFGGGACLVATGLTVTAFILPPVSDADISSWLFASTRAGDQGVGTDSGGAETIGFASSVNLGGSLVSRPKPVLTYSTDTETSAYLSVVADTDFDKGNWYPSARAATGGYTWTGLQYSSGQLPRDANPGDGGVGNDEQTVHARITLTAGYTGSDQFALFTGEPEGVNFPGIAFGVVSAATPNELLTVDSVQFVDAASSRTATLETTSLTSTATVDELRAAGTDYPAWTQQYTELNDDSTGGAGVIQSLAQQWTSGLPDPYSQALAIEDHLRNPALFHYTLNPPADPSDRVWPLVYFLTTSHRGYCQYFASAMGAMLRSLGIPTRLISGYGPGTAQDLIKPIPSVDQQVVTTSDAHTWVEAYFPGYGWIPFEPTPPSAQGDYQPFARGQAAIAQQVPPPSPAGPPAATKPRLKKPATEPGTPIGAAHGSISTEVVLVSVSGGLLALLAAVFFWFLLPRSVSAAWHRVETLGAITGVDRRAAETHQGFAARLGRSRPNASRALSELAALAARAEFSAAGASSTERMLALRTWRRALRVMSTSTWRRRTIRAGDAAQRSR